MMPNVRNTQSMNKPHACSRSHPLLLLQTSSRRQESNARQKTATDGQDSLRSRIHFSRLAQPPDLFHMMLSMYEVKLSPLRCRQRSQDRVVQ
jgi:hypothetical protein